VRDRPAFMLLPPLLTFLLLASASVAGVVLGADKFEADTRGRAESAALDWVSAKSRGGGLLLRAAEGRPAADKPAASNATKALLLCRAHRAGGDACPRPLHCTSLVPLTCTTLLLRYPRPRAAPGRVVPAVG
jgi:hypothetical protein